MDAWLKNQAEKLAQAAQQQLADLEQKTSQLAEGVLEKVGVSAGKGARELEFDEWDLGLHLDGVIVVNVEAQGQAARLGVEIGDRLVAVAGYPVPQHDPSDHKKEKRVRKMVAEWIEEMPRPVVLSFMPFEQQVEVEEIPHHTRETAEVSSMQLLQQHTPPRSDIDEAGELSCEAGDPQGGLPDTKTLVAIVEEVVAVPVVDHLDGTAVPYEAAPAEASVTADTDRAPAVTSCGALPDSAISPPTPDAEEELLSASRLKAEVVGEANQDGELPAVQGENANTEGKAGSRMKALRSELRQMAASLDAERRHSALHQKKVADLQKQVSALRTEKKEILLGVSKGEAENFSALEAAEFRRKALEEEMERLRQALASTEASLAEVSAHRDVAIREKEEALVELKEVRRNAAIEQAASTAEVSNRLQREIDALKVSITQAEGTASTAELQREALERELRGFQGAHEAELELLREEQRELEKQQQRQLQEHEQQFAERERQAALELAAARGQVEAAQLDAAVQRERAEAAAVEAAAAAVEASAVRMEAAKAAEQLASLASPGDEDLEEVSTWDALPSDTSKALGAGIEVSALQERISMLERRCVGLQKKLHARAASRPGHDLLPELTQRRPPWQDRLSSLAGERVAELAVIAYNVPDVALRNFTRQMLKSDLLLWLFYSHLIVLYTISMQCFSEATADQGGDVEALGEGVVRLSKPRPS